MIIFPKYEKNSGLLLFLLDGKQSEKLMIDDELLSGENVNIEYKREVPEKSIKYVKRNF